MKISLSRLEAAVLLHALRIGLEDGSLTDNDIENEKLVNGVREKLLNGLKRQDD